MSLRIHLNHYFTHSSMAMLLRYCLSYLSMWVLNGIYHLNEIGYPENIPSREMPLKISYPVKYLVWMIILYLLKDIVSRSNSLMQALLPTNIGI